MNKNIFPQKVLAKYKPVSAARVLGLSRWLALFMMLSSVTLTADAAVDQGKALYLKHCSQCHEGNVPRAPHSVLFNMAQRRISLLPLTTA